MALSLPGDATGVHDEAEDDRKSMTTLQQLSPHHL